MRWISDGAPLEPMIERSTRLTGDELVALAERYDASRSHVLRAQVDRDFAFGMAWDLLPPQVSALCDVVTDAAHRANVPDSVAKRAWEAVADEMTARLFPQLPASTVAELGEPWRVVVGHPASDAAVMPEEIRAVDELRSEIDSATPSSR